MDRGGLSFLLLTNFNRIRYLCDFRRVVARWVYYAKIARRGRDFLSRVQARIDLQMFSEI